MRGAGESNGCERLKDSPAKTFAAVGDTIVLSTAQEEFNSSIMDGTGRDTSDAEFSAFVDFEVFNSQASSITQAVFDIGGGGGGDGVSVVYGDGNELILTICGDVASRVSTSYTLTPEQVSAGTLEVTAVVDIDSAEGNGAEDVIKLLIDK